MTTTVTVPDLAVPADFVNKTLDDGAVISWHARIEDELRLLSAQEVSWFASKPEVLSGVAGLSNQDASFPDPWLSSSTQLLAQNLLASITPTTDTILAILNTYVKPHFLANPHPQLALGTARALKRPAGGPHATQDHYAEQHWKLRPGLASIVAWCIRSLPANSFESAWPQIVPPVMTFLDDYQTPYKRHGVFLAHLLGTHAPPSLLSRTGVGALLLSSLLHALSVALHDPIHTPPLIRVAVHSTLALLDRTTVPNSAERVNKLSELLGEKIIGGVWVFASREPDAIKATMDVLPDLVGALGVGVARFLKALIPQCVHCLTVSEYELMPSISLQSSALRALLSIMRACPPRVAAWKGTIIAGVGTFWVKRKDQIERDGAGGDDEGEEKTTELVRDVFAELARLCPSVVEDEYKQLGVIDPAALQDILVYN